MASIKSPIEQGAKTTASSGSTGAYSLKNFVRERTVDGKKWNKVFPYVLRMGKFGDGGLPSNATSSAKNFLSGAAAKTTNGIMFNQNKSVKLGAGNTPQVVLPITPQNISVTTPAASTLSVTLRGIVEEHNGSPIRKIVINGTTGVLPTKLGTSGVKPSSSGGLVSELFSNTIRAAQDVKRIATGAQNDLLADPNAFNGNITTGYMFFHQLVDFVDQYFFFKKQAANKQYYCVFEMQKDELYYRCSIKNFSWRKRPGTLEYDYTLELDAWSYENKAEEGVNAFGIKGTTVSKLSKVVSDLKQTRKVLAASRNVIRGVGQDIDRVFQIMNEMIFVAKDAVGILESMGDLPKNMVKSFQSLVLKELSNLKNAVDGAERAYPQVFNAKKIQAIATTEQGSQPSQSEGETVSSSALMSKIFDDPYAYPEFFDAIELDSITVPETLQNSIDEYKEALDGYGADYWVKKRDELINFSNGFANAIGAGSDTYNRVLGVNEKNARKRDIRMSELQALRAIQELISASNVMILQKRNLDLSVQNYVDFYVNLAQINGIPFTAPVGKFAVPVPLGASLQSIAVQYLGDVNRWIEIAAINQLRSPFIDEVGFEKNIKGFTNGNIITLSDVKDLYINQPILVTDNAKSAISARIKNIQIIDPVTSLVTLDKDVTGYSEDTEAKIKAYLPNTVNSNMLIYIPTETSPTVLAEDFKFSPDISDQTALAAVAGSDIALTSEGDIAVLPSGDVRVVTGTANLLQAAKLKIVTPKGSLINHPEYGLGVLAGSNTAEFDTDSAFKRIEEIFAQDDRYGSVLASRINKIGPTVEIDVTFSLPNTDSVLPVSVNLRQ